MVGIENMESNRLYGAFGVAALWTVSSIWLFTPHIAAATFAYFLLLFGFLMRKRNRKLHISFMAAGMALDLSLVLMLQAQRDAIGTAVSMTLTPLQQIHVIVSTIAVVLYFPMVWIGIRFANADLSDQASKRKKHRTLGLITFVFRTLGFFLMFSMLGRNS